MICVLNVKGCQEKILDTLFLLLYYSQGDLNGEDI